MKRLAIKGHPTRGEEVIEILKMLGGINKYEISNTNVDLLYTIRSYDKSIIGVYPTDTFVVFTLEEFIEKFPYKVGDKVLYYEKPVFITQMECIEDSVFYHFYYKGREFMLPSKHLQPYKQNINMENKEIIPTLDGKELGGGYISYVIPEGYTYDGFNSLGEIILKPNKIQYPKNYEECCDVLRMPKDESYIDIDVPLSYNKVLTVFTQLLICRDAYWKIFGEEMKLGKPWEPDFNDNNDKHFICYVRDEVWMSYIKDCNKVLVFPTEEMRNIFYENFKKEIEICKKLI